MDKVFPQPEKEALDITVDLLKAEIAACGGIDIDGLTKCFEEIYKTVSGVITEANNKA